MVTRSFLLPSRATKLTTGEPLGIRLELIGLLGFKQKALGPAGCGEKPYLILTWECKHQGEILSSPSKTPFF